MRHAPISEKRQKLIDEKNNSPLVVGEDIWCYYNSVTNYPDEKRKGQSVLCIVLELDNNKIKVKHSDSTYQGEYWINYEDIKSRDLSLIGANMFDERVDGIQIPNITQLIGV